MQGDLCERRDTVHEVQTLGYTRSVLVGVFLPDNDVGGGGKAEGPIH